VNFLLHTKSLLERILFACETRKIIYRNTFFCAHDRQLPARISQYNSQEKRAITRKIAVCADLPVYHTVTSVKYAKFALDFPV
jgi:hypothetical protein